jgi:hypothetical protein
MDTFSNVFDHFEHTRIYNNTLEYNNKTNYL